MDGVQAQKVRDGGLVTASIEPRTSRMVRTIAKSFVRTLLPLTARFQSHMVGATSYFGKIKLQNCHRLGVTQITCCDSRLSIEPGSSSGPRSRLAIIRFAISTLVNAKGFMDDVKPWIKDYFLILATKYGSKFDTAPPTEKVKRCQLKKVRGAVSVQQSH